MAGCPHENVGVSRGLKARRVDVSRVVSRYGHDALECLLLELSGHGELVPDD